MKYERNNAYLQHDHRSPPNARCRCTDTFGNQINTCMQGPPMVCDLVYLTSGFKTPTILQKFMTMAYWGKRRKQHRQRRLRSAYMRNALKLKQN